MVTAARKPAREVRCIDCGTTISESLRDTFMVADRSFNQTTRQYEWTGNWICRDLGYCIRQQEVNANV